MALRDLLRTDRPNQDFLKQCSDLGTDRLDGYELYERYYGGDHRTKLRDRMRTFLELSGKPFAENFCDVTVDVVTERLKVIGFQSSLAGPDENGDMQDPVGEVLEEWMQRVRLDAIQQRVHSGAVRLGDYFVIVEWDYDHGIPRFSCNHPCRVKVEYSDEYDGQAELAVKVWSTKQSGPGNPDGRLIQRMNLYYPDRVEKYFRVGTDGEWARWTDEDGAWRMPWVDKAGLPLGVPVFHWRYKPLDSTYGVSRLSDVLPFQDEINKTVLDLNELCDNHGLPQRWTTGVSGNVEFKSNAGNVWTASSELAKFGQFDVAPTGELLNAIEGLLSRLARKTRTPMHLLTGGTPPSGESLKTSESGLIAVAQAAQTGFGNAWEDAFTLALKLAQDEGALGFEIPDDFTLETQWENPETRSDKEDLETALLKQRLGISTHTLIGELGYDPERESERKQAEDEVAAELAAKSFDAGAPL